MGFSLGGSKSSSNSNSSANTYVDESQQPFLDDIRNQAQGLNAQGMPVEGVAGINPQLSSALGSANQAGAMQAGVGAGMISSGANATQGTGMALNYAQNAMGATGQNGINSAMGAGQQMAGMAAMSNGAYNGGFNPNNASRYMNNDVLNGQIDAAGRDVTRNLQENQLTGIASQAAGSGNSGSSRAGVMAGIAARGAGDRIGDIGAQMRGQAYNAGLGFESNRAAQNAGFAQQTAMGNQNAYNSAMQAGAGFGQNAYNSSIQEQQYGANMAQNIGQAGYGNMQNGADMMNSGLATQQGAGQYMRDYEQQGLSNEYQQAMSPYNSLSYYNDIVGAPNNLSTASSASSSSSKSFSLGAG